MVSKKIIINSLIALIDLRIKSIKGIVLCRNNGICVNAFLPKEEGDFICNCFNLCKSFSGERHYPVAGGNVAYMRARDLWVGEYGKARIKFLDELIMVIDMKLARGEYAN